nr:hypothetical protein [Tanacetum cinerariifolium]
MKTSVAESLDQILDMLHKLISQLEILSESLSQEDINLKFLRSLPSEWRTHTLIWRNKADLDDQIFHDASTVSETIPTVFNVEPSNTKPTKEMSQSNMPFAPIIEYWVSDSEDESEGEPIPTQKEPSFVQTYEHLRTPRTSVKPGNPQQALKDKTVIDSGCSRHMTSNISYLSNFTEINGGYVAFGGNPKGGKITGKVTFLESHDRIEVLLKDWSNVIVGSLITASFLLLAALALGIGAAALPHHPAYLRLFEYVLSPNDKPVVVVVEVMMVEQWEIYVVMEMEKYSFVNPLKYPDDPDMPALEDIVYSDLRAKFEEFSFNSTNRVNAVRNQPNSSAGIQGNFNAGKVEKESVSSQKYELLPLWFTGSKDPQNTDADATFDDKENESEVYVSLSSRDKPKKHDEKATREAKGKSLVDLVNAANTPVTTVGLNSTNSTNRFNATGPFDNAISSNFEIGGKSLFVDPSKYLDDPNMPALDDIVYSDDEKDVGAKADFSNLETSITISPIPTTRVHKDYPVTSIIDDLSSAPQTKSMIRVEPKRVHQALKDPCWIEAMQEELLQFKMQKVWVLVDLLKGKRAIGSKWVFRNKKDERVIVIKNKARLVAQGHSQEEGIDYEDVFAPVARIEAIFLFLDHASFMSFMVYKMVKALCGLHQAPRAWYEKLANYLLENEFQKGNIDQTLFIKNKKGDILLVQVYVNDIILGSTNKELCKAFEKLMKDKF